MKKLFSLILILLFAAGCSSQLQKEDMTLEERVMLFSDNMLTGKYDFDAPRGARVDTFEVKMKDNVLAIFMNKRFGYMPFRENNVEKLYEIARKDIITENDNLKLQFYANGAPVEKLIPNFFRSSKDTYDVSKLAKKVDRPVPLIQREGEKYENGLYDKNVIVWHSHGWYYSRRSDRWEWQRARLFQTVEDLIPMAFTVPYIIPMMENAGATVFVPRERDLNKTEAVVDNDTPDINGTYKEVSSDGFEWSNCDNPGFNYGEPPYEANFNPFLDGTARKVKSNTTETASVIWNPEIKETSEYAVYVSWQQDDNNVTDAHYTVYHEGGKTEFKVNQQIGGGTWHYLGSFKFNEGLNLLRGVKLSNKSSEPGKYVTADAVRFGGGMGVVKRNGKTSGRPKFVEGSRYWLQYAGMPDTLVYSFNDNKNDYSDDYKSRGEYANYLYGAPFGPNVNRDVKGLGIPMDASIAFHTDAGITRNDTTVGTLLIYSSTDLDSVNTFPDGVSRQTNRDYADIMQTQIVEDIMAKYDPAWNRRQLMDALYSEAFRPNFPGVLIELLSHQNFLDMQFMLDPDFRFDVSRAIYKSTLKYLATQYDYEYVVQPLPVDHFYGEFTDSNVVKLAWKPVVDTLEETANADKFIVYTRVNNGGFNNGTVTDKPEFVFEDIKAGNIYSFKVEAVNKGGKSFPSEILSFGIAENSTDTALVINGFDRVAAPYYFEDSTYGGFLNSIDNGVPYKYDLGFTGEQNDFLLSSKFLSNDAPGHGGSYADEETNIIAGNTFDFPYIHGKALLNNGCSFVSVSDESIFSNTVSMNNYKLVDLILGEEKETFKPRDIPEEIEKPQYETFPTELRTAITNYTNAGGKLFISGAYIGTGLVKTVRASKADKEFAKDVLKFIWNSNHASRKGDVFITNDTFDSIDNTYKFNTSLNKDIYCVEAADAISPVHGESVSLMRYTENSYNAAVGYKGDYSLVLLGFPFETVLDELKQTELMNKILNYLK